MIYTRLAKKQIEKLPRHIFYKLNFWLNLIEEIGLYEVRKYKGYHDESLSGARLGERSIRLSKGYRLIYQELQCEFSCLIEVIEVNKHDYKK